MTLQTTVRLLKLGSLTSALFSLAFLLGLVTPLQGFLNLFLDIVHWPLDSQQRLDGDSAGVLAAISSGLMMGMGVLIWRIVDLVYVEDPERGARIILPGVFTWYLPDSIGSYAVGAEVNVLLNTGFLAMFVLPILLHQRHRKAALT